MRPLRHVLVPALIGLALAACSTSRASVHDGKPRTPAVTGLARSFEIHETRRGSATTKVIGDELVDYESEIVVKPDPAKLRALAGAAGGVVRDTPATTLEKLLKPTLDSITGFVRQATAYQESRSDTATALAEDPAWRALQQSELDVVNNLIVVSSAIVAFEFDLSDPTWSDKGPEGMGVSDERFEEWNARRAELDNLFKPPAPVDATGTPVERAAVDEVDVAAVVREVNRVLAEEKRRLEALAEVVHAGYDLQISAEILRGSEAYPISVPPYTHVDGQTRGPKSRRVSMPDAQDLERLEKEFDANDRLVRSIERTRELVGDPEKFAAALKEFGPALRKYLDEAKVRLEQDLRKLVDAQEPQLAPIVAAAKKVQAALAALATAVDALVGEAGTLTPPAVLRAASGIEMQIRDGLGGALKELSAAIQAVTEVPEPRRAAVAALRAAADREVAEIQKALENTAIGASLGGLIGVLRDMRTLARAETFGDLKAGKVTRKSFAIEKAPDGAIQLANSPAEADDVLRITYELTERKPDATEPPDAWRESTLLDVRKFGFYTTYNSQVLFADRIGDGSSRYQAAAGISINLHYRPERGRTFFDVVAPGVGLCVAAPSFENGVELAVGLQATFFNDTIQAGYLYDISVEDDPWAFYFGLDLIQAFRSMN